ncbi:MAG: hypothetical protein HDT43_03595 [Ruminococcaceae bacterium]|nr:hypothetical protein [Oscillospiraceae bacterium]
MKKSKKIILTVLAVIFGLLVLSNSFMIYILVETVRAEHSVIDLRPSIYMNALLTNDEETLATDNYKQYITDILMDDPSIITREPVIFLANPGIKPIIAEILVEEPSILVSNPKIVTRNPELLELNPELKNTVKEYIEQHKNDSELTVNMDTLTKLAA